MKKPGCGFLSGIYTLVFHFNAYVGTQVFLIDSFCVLAGRNVVLLGKAVGEVLNGVIAQFLRIQPTSPAYSKKLPREIPGQQRSCRVGHSQI